MRRCNANSVRSVHALFAEHVEHVELWGESWGERSGASKTFSHALPLHAHHFIASLRPPSNLLANPVGARVRALRAVCAAAAPDATALLEAPPSFLTDAAHVLTPRSAASAAMRVHQRIAAGSHARQCSAQTSRVPAAAPRSAQAARQRVQRVCELTHRIRVGCLRELAVERPPTLWDP